jgi:hypothetical protein
MTKLMLETLVLDGVRVATRNVTGLVRLAANEAGKWGTTVLPSVKRHLLSSPALLESDPRQRSYAMNHGDKNAPRAGRLAVSAGVFHSRIPPTTGGRACLVAAPAIGLPLFPCSRPHWLRTASGRINGGFGQPSQARAFTSQLSVQRLSPLGRKHETRTPRMETAGHTPARGR